MRRRPASVGAAGRDGTAWHVLSTGQVLRRLETDLAAGLTEVEAARRRERFGPNELADPGRQSRWRLLAEQFTATMVVVLLVAAAVSLVLGEYADAIVILAIVVLNAVLGYWQEARAEQAIAALRRLAAPTVRARRDGRTKELPARELVPGDVVLLEAGSLVPADGRLVEAANLRTQEAALTGESAPVDKEVGPLADEALPVADRRNQVFVGTVVVNGRGLMAVTACGMDTELGRLAGLLQAVRREPTPLQRRLARLGRWLAVAVLALVAIIFGLGVGRGEDARLMFMTALGLAVAVVPESLPAVATVTLALGAQRMLRRNALIRKLPAVETLGSVTVICTDKTGTLTQNRMTVATLVTAGQVLGRGDPDGRAAPLVLAAGALCNDALPPAAGDFDAGRSGPPLGDPTEVALMEAAEKAGLRKATLDAALPRVAELPFDAVRKRMTTVHRVDATLPAEWGLEPAPFLAFSKGAADGLLTIAGSVLADGQPVPLDQAGRARLMAANERLAESGMRVLGLALRSLAALPPAEQLESELTFLGLVALLDPPRPEAAAAIASCRSAGIRVVMVTGDHPLTADHIARQLALADGGPTVTGPELDRLSDAELAAAVDHVGVYARVTPEHKLRIVRAFQSRGQMVAVTGDGVNDAPALKQAEIGVAMGRSGSDVAKDVSAMVLLDDDFKTIVAAVEEGRVIYDNIRKFVQYILTGNCGEIWTMLLAPLVGLPLPLLPLQILWVNLVTDGLPALALGLEPPERGVMRRPPDPPGESLLGRGLSWHILRVGLLIGLTTLGLAYAYRSADRAEWQTVAFTTLALLQMGQVLAIRTGRASLFSVGLRSNLPLLAAVLLTLVLQLGVIYLPPLQQAFRTTPLGPLDLLVVLAASSAAFWAVELEKWLGRRRRPLAAS